jgi:L-asparaginase
MMKKRVLILYTGGTIGMVPSDQGYVPMSGLSQRLEQQLQGRALESLPAYEVLEFEQLIDSSNLVPADWSRIGGYLQQHWDQYDGFVVLHGTDTMAYTASALSFMLQGINKPVLVTGSQIPLAEVRSDALDNLITSLLLATRDDIHEVCILFNGRLLRGNRSVKCNSTGFDAFDSPNLPWLGRIGINMDIDVGRLLTSHNRSPIPEFYIPVFDPNAVAVLTLYPGITAAIVQSILTTDGLKALIIQSYGVGNPPDSNQALMQLLEDACERGMVVVNLTQCYRGPVVQGAYATGAVLNKIGVTGGSDLTLEAAFAKLHYLLASGVDTDDIRQQMATPVCGECR